jgi:hypothetical protein
VCSDGIARTLIGVAILLRDNAVQTHRAAFEPLNARFPNLVAIAPTAHFRLDDVEAQKAKAAVTEIQATGSWPR